ncbi:ABC-2 family transporter protein [compost metagenome]
MNKWLRQFRFELGMIFRNPWLLILLVLFGVLILWVVHDAHASQVFHAQSYNALTLVHTLSLGLVMLMGILAIRRDIRRKTYEWSDAIPLSNTTKITAKYVATLLYFTLFTIAATVIYAYYSAKTGGDASVTLTLSKYYATTFEVSYAVTLALSILLAICISNRIVYLIGFCAWMFGTFFMEIFLIDRMYLFPLRTFHLSQLFISIQMDNEVWATAQMDEELMYSRLFVLAFTLLLLVAGITILNCLRRTKHLFLVWGTAITALLLACGSFMPYGGLWQGRYAQYKEKLADPTIQTMEQFTPIQNPTYEITDYDVSMHRRQNDYLETKATIKLNVPTDGHVNELPFTLNRAFSVSQVKVNGVGVSFQHQGEQLTIKLNENISGPVKVEMDYAGVMMDYYMRSNGNGEFTAFVKGGNVFLPQYIGWYPLPGYQSVYAKEVDHSNVRLAPVHYEMDNRAPANFRLTLTGFKSPLYTSIPEQERSEDRQIFAGPVNNKITLFGGELKEMKRSGLPVTVVTSPYNASAVNVILDHLSEMNDYFGSWLQNYKPNINQFIYFPINNYMPFTSENQTYVVTQGYWDNKYISEILMNAMMIGSRNGSYLIENTEDDVRLQIRALLWYVYYREQEGLTDKELKDGWGNNMLWELYDSNNSIDPARLGLRMSEQVGKAIDEGKSKQVKEVLSFFYNQNLEIVDDTGGDSPSGNRISYAQWEKEWKRVMESESGS